MKYRSFMLICMLIPFGLAAQDIFPSLTGEELLDSLRTNYRPSLVLSYSDARDTIYALIDNENDTVYGVYSRHGLFLPEDVDPSQWLYMSGSSLGINAEHTWPTSKGATEGTNAHSDMHHLFPARSRVNSDRSDFPFCEIEDQLTDNWYYKDQIMSSIPASMIDRYSEGVQGMFEPREDWKGNVARAMFYFYTMYRDQADAEDANFFDVQRECLCEWHFQDPADDAEILRSLMVATYQDDKQNPFVLDCSLPERSFCADIGLSCLTPADDVPDTELSFRVYYEHGLHKLQIRLDLPASAFIVQKIYGLDGRLILSDDRSLPEGDNIYYLSIPPSTPSGLYIVEISGNSGNEAIRGFRKFVISR